MKIWLLICQGGDYEEAWSNNSIGFKEEAFARQVADLLNIHEEETQRKIFILQKQHKEWFSANPFTNFVEEPIPRWGSGFGALEITEAMRQERDNIKARNAEIQSKNNRARANQLELWLIERDRICEEIGLVLDNPELPFPAHEDCSWCIEELEVPDVG